MYFHHRYCKYVIYEHFYDSIAVILLLSKKAHTSKEYISFTHLQ